MTKRFSTTKCKIVSSSMIIGVSLLDWWFIEMTTVFLIGSIIIGFITGSLGVIWPWKKEIYKLDNFGEIMYDSNGDIIIVNYQRYLPEIAIMETWIAIFFIILGILILLSIDWYGKRRKKVRVSR